MVPSARRQCTGKTGDYKVSIMPRRSPASQDASPIDRADPRSEDEQAALFARNTERFGRV